MRWSNQNDQLATFNLMKEILKFSEPSNSYLVFLDHFWCVFNESLHGSFPFLLTLGGQAHWFELLGFHQSCDFLDKSGILVWMMNEDWEWNYKMFQMFELFLKPFNCIKDMLECIVNGLWLLINFSESDTMIKEFFWKKIVLGIDRSWS